jgi:quinol monooxygenase YgiN
MTILVTGTLDIDPAKRDAFIAAATTVMEGSQAEAGCEHYAFSADLHDPGRFHISEQWADKAAMDAHGASPHFLTFMGSMGDFGVKGASLTKWEGATGGPLM